MPKNEVVDLITDQEMVFARHVLSGTMTDRQAAVAAGLTAETAAYTKAKPRVRAYMLEYRAATQQQHANQETDLSRHAVAEQHRKNLTRERVLDRLWEIANLSPELTRGSATAQMKALSMIVAIEELIPDRKAQKQAPLPNSNISVPAPAAAAAPSRPASSPSPAMNVRESYVPHPATVKSHVPDVAAAFS
jgi:hypothetical protein